MKVLVTPHLLQSDAGPHVRPLRDAGFDIVYPPAGCDTLIRDNIVRLLTGEVAAILASTEPLSREVLGQSRLRVVARMGVGFDSVDVEAATELGIPVTITPGTLEVSVAEQTVAMLLGLTRGIISRDRDVRRGVWPRTPLPRLDGGIFGLVGLGRIGRAVVPRVRGLGMRILALEPQPDAAFVAEHDIEIAESLDRLLRQSDVVSLHAPCTPATAKMINARTLALMKPDAILINTSRGGLVDEHDLVAALDAGHLFGAALDVFEREPLPLDSPLLACVNVLTSTHMGGLDQTSTRLAGELAARCIADLSRGVWPDGCVVNDQLKSGWQWSERNA